MNFIKNTLFALTLISIAVVFQNCGKDDKGNQVTAGLISEPDGLNPVLNITNGYARQIMERHIFAFLGDTDPNTYQNVPFLAKAEPIITPIDTGAFKGGIAYTFEILDEAKWDNGLPITGHDLVFSVKAILNPKVNAAAWRGYVEFIKDIKVDASNPKKVTLYTDKFYILAVETLNNIFFIPDYNYDPKGLMKSFSIRDLGDKTKTLALSNDPAINEFANDFNTNYSRNKDKIVGCGAYKVEAWEKGQYVILKKKENWWGNSLMSSRIAMGAYPETLVYKFYQNSQTQLTDLKAGNLDLMTSIDPAEFVKMQKDENFKKNYNLFLQPSGTAMWLTFNTKNEKFTDKLTRNAIANAIDVDAIIKNVAEGMATRMNTITFDTKDFNRKDLAPIPYNVEKAKQLLAEAGWKDTNNNGVVDKKINGVLKEFQVSFLITDKGTTPNIALMIQNYLKAIGIGVELVTKDFNVFKEEVKKGNFEMTIQTARASISGPDDLEQKWHSQKGSNDSKFGNPSLDAMIDQINQTLDVKKRNELYGRFQQIIYDEQPVVVLFRSQERVAISKRFADAKATSMSPYTFEHLFRVK